MGPNIVVDHVHVAVCVGGENMEEKVLPYKRHSVLVRGCVCVMMLEEHEWK